MIATIFKDFNFEAAHKLPNVPEGHKCGQLHGHSFKFQLTLVGEVNPNSGWVVDFGDVKIAVKPLIDLLDHNYLNDIDGLANPTSENVAIFIASWLCKCAPHLPVKRVTVWETCTCGASVDV